MWTQFWDMHSGGGTKEEPYDSIYIEASQEEAKIIFFNRFGHNPERVSCTCCGGDYSIDERESLSQLTGFHRNCRSLETPRGEDGLYMNDDPIIAAHLYLEKDEKPPKGYKLSEHKPWGEYQTLEEYKQRDDVLIIQAGGIEDKERVGEVPQQGYVWV